MKLFKKDLIISIKMENISLKEIYSNQDGITNVSFEPDNLNYMYILMKTGKIIKLNTTTSNEEIFLDLSKEINELYDKKPFKLDFADERGLLNIIFHPEYNKSGSLFKGVFIVFSSMLNNNNFYDERYKKFILEPDHMSCVSQFVYKGDNIETMKTRRIIFCVPQPEANHNGGSMAFGPDGYLWLGFGDGGGANDEHGILIDKKDKESFLGFAQNPFVHHGKILRIEVIPPMDQAVKYKIPNDNPFVNDKQWLKEIVGYGFRNPWRFSFDSEGRLFVADVGQNRFESIKLITDLGKNHGWRAIEGKEIFNKTLFEYLEEKNIVYPIISYPRNLGHAITGVILNEKSNIPELKNKLLFVDYKGNIFYGWEKNNKWKYKIIGDAGILIFSLNQNTNNGNIYITGYDKDKNMGVVKQIISSREAFLTEEDILKIKERCINSANKTKSDLRKNRTCKMQIAIIRLGNKKSTLIHSMEDAWQGSIDIAKGKAFTSMAFSSNENAFTSRTIGVLSGDGTLLNIGNSNKKGVIIEFPGGVPLYKTNKNNVYVLVGGLGISGDSVNNDELVVRYGSDGFKAPNDIRNSPFYGN